ncbi:MAG TPA: PQQ-binding-like beta-propeller repeat protein [Anaerolineaceae bacterium]|nr:PQQ-like beta-propeller repeat protein [Longilinea sp.]HNS63841.1 PQQ-binding-like beta-propeller repeat protein [Anaerolineaceae bacterium]HOD43699.1 PQQ-binding-like beta-propeller repeat protein [Anaerolineaceae bacterium]HPA33203.1 PQQ-binding-like beta-propeller repeat protein [Anaerolineaceae bacterium]HQF45454.1 PQQ-binding-like beta-propeller repeat protein [Anaerolineaceae bacterium]
MILKKRFSLLLLLVAGALLLSACGGVMTASSWPGITGNGDVAYVAATTYVHAIRLSDGSEVWRYPEKAEPNRMFYAAPVLVGDQLIVGDYRNELHSINPDNGKLNWSFTGAKGKWITSPLALDTMLLAPCADHFLYALDLNGNLLWKFETGEPIWATPTTDGKFVYVASMDHHVYALDPATGQEQWKTDMGAAIIFTPTLSEEGILYLATLAREVLAVRNTGEILWRQSVENLVWSQPVVRNGSMYFADTSGKVYSVKTADGSIQWTQSIGGEAGTAALGVPAVLDDALIYGLENGELVAISYSGDRLWTRSVNGTLYSGPVLAGDRLLVGVTQGDRLVVSFDLNGNESWSFTPAK